MNTNPAPTSIGLVTWDGLVTTPVDISKHNHFGFVARVETVIAVDAVFKVKAHAALGGNPCAPDAAVDVPEVIECADFNATPAADSVLTIPAGTLAGCLVMFTIPCRPGQFVSLAAISGSTALVTAVAVLHGPKI